MPRRSTKPRPSAKAGPSSPKWREVKDIFGEEEFEGSDDSDEELFRSVSTNRSVTDYGLNYTGNTSRSRINPRQQGRRPQTPARPRVPAASTQRTPRKSPAANASVSTPRKSPRKSPVAGTSRQFAESPTYTPRAARMIHTTARTTTQRSPTRTTTQRSPTRTTTQRSPTRTTTQRSPTRSRPRNERAARSRRKQAKPKSKTNILKEIRHLQSTYNTLIPRLPFSRLFKEILSQYAGGGLRVTPTALEALQESSELYLVQLLADAYRCTLHRSRITLMPKDMDLVRYLRGCTDPGNVDL